MFSPEEDRIIVTRRTPIIPTPGAIIRDDFRCARYCVQYFILTVSVISVILFFIILELGITQLSGEIEQIPGISSLIAQSAFNGVQAANVANNLGVICANCVVSSFCSCLNGPAISLA